MTKGDASLLRSPALGGWAGPWWRGWFGLCRVGPRPGHRKTLEMEREEVWRCGRGLCSQGGALEIPQDRWWVESLRAGPWGRRLVQTAGVCVALLCSPGRSHINGQVTLGFPKTTKREGISRVRASPELSTPRFCVRATPTTSTAGRRQEESQTQGAEGLGIPS